MNIDELIELKDLEKAYMSQVKLVVDSSGQKHILKKTPGKEYNNNHHEKLFYDYCKQINIPTLKISQPQGSHPDQFLLNYLENSYNLSKNPTKDLMFKLGKYLSRIHYQKFDFQYRYKDGKKVYLSWNEFIEETKNYLETKLNQFPQKRKDRYFNLLDQVSDIKLSPSFIHGDLHIDNVLVQDQEVYIFDPSDILIVGDYRYDICGLLLNFPNFRNIDSQDWELWNSFCSGYGLESGYYNEDFKKILIFVAIENIKNPFLSYLDLFIEDILEDRHEICVLKY